MGLSAALSLGGSLLSGALSAKSAGSQNKTTKKALDKVGKLGDETTAQVTERFQPYETAGLGGLNALTSFMSGDLSGYEASPFYKATEAMYDSNSNAMRRMFAAGGALGSGGAMRDLGNARYKASLGGYNDYLNGNVGLTGMGFNATGGITNALNNNFQTQASVLTGKAASSNAAAGARYGAIGDIFTAGANAAGKWFG
jgi:hypothetical protein